MTLTLSRWAIDQGLLDEAELSQLLQPAPHAMPAHLHALGLALSLARLRPRCQSMDTRILPPDIRSSVIERQLAFIGGRLCAEQALARLGVTAAVERRADGVPLWPAGTVGSITHTRDAAYALCSLDPALAGLGIDSERRLGEAELADILPVFSTEAERARIELDARPCLAGNLLFSAKESLYKAIYRRAGRFVDFSEVEMTTLDWNAHTLRLQPAAHSDLRTFFSALDIRFCFDQRHVHTLTAWRAT